MWHSERRRMRMPRPPSVLGEPTTSPRSRRQVRLLFCFLFISPDNASVTNLESVVLEVQDSLRKVQHERDSLRLQIEEHAKYCKAVYPVKRRGQMLNEEQMSSSSPYSDNSHCGTSSHSTPHLHPFNNLHYRDEGPSAYTNAPSSHGADYTTSSFQNNDLTPDATGSIGHLHRTGGAQYPYAMTESSRDMRNGWQVPMHPTLHGGDAVMSGHHSQSPAYMNSPSITSVHDQIPEFSGRICAEDSKAHLGPTQDGAPCVFPDDNQYRQSLVVGSHPSRSASTSHPPAPTPMTSSIAPFTFPDHPQDGGGEFDYRHPHSPQLIPPDDSLSGQPTDNIRYRISGRRTSADHHQMLASTNEANIQDLNDEGHVEMTHRNTNSSRSPSPSRPSISCTVAVIRAQSFGALRRTRASVKKSTEAARITLDVLQSRGIGLRDSNMASTQTLIADDRHHDTIP